MKVLFEWKFIKDINALSDKQLKQQIEQAIIEMENALSLKHISNLKKLKGHKTACRIRIGDYRLGLFFENQNLVLTCFLHRKDMYKYFPY